MLNPTDIDSNSFKFGSIILKNYRGESIDIKKVVSSIEVTESIYSLFDVYEITVADGNGLMELYGLTCNEKIEVTIFKKDLSDEEEKMITKKLVVIEIIDYEKPHEMTQVFKLRCILESALNSSVKRISRSIKGSIDQMIKIISNEVIKEKINYKSSQSLGNFNFVVPNLTYTELFSIMTRAAVNDNGSPVHLFETLWNDFIYQSYSDMVNSKPLMDYEYKLFNKERHGSDKFKDGQLKRIKSISSSFDLSLFSALKDGVYDCTINRVDISEKKYNKVHFDLYKTKTPSIDKHSFLRNGIVDYDSPKVITQFVNNSSFEEGTNIRTIDSELYAKKNSTFNKQYGLTHTIDIDGITKLSVGSTITIQIPPSHGVSETKNKEDSLLSGKYLVVNIRHTFISSGRYTMSVDIKKDSMNFDILPRPEKGNTNV